MLPSLVCSNIATLISRLLNAFDTSYQGDQVTTSITLPTVPQRAFELLASHSEESEWMRRLAFQRNFTTTYTITTLTTLTLAT